MTEIIPGILEQTWEEVEKKIQLLSPFAKTLHIDVIDGKFAPNTTFLDPVPFKKYADNSPSGEAGVFLEVHLMVENALDYLKPFADAGFKRFIGHVEKMSDVQIEEFVAQGQILGEVGLALDAQTPVEDLKINFDDLDFILIMTVKTGFSNQGFMSEMLEKVKKIREKSPTIPIEVDGGINDQTILLAKQAGANRFASSSFISKATDPKQTYLNLQSLVSA